MYHQASSLVPAAAGGERTCEEVDAVCCQVGLWEDEGKLAESAPFDFPLHHFTENSA